MDYLVVFWLVLIPFVVDVGALTTFELSKVLWIQGGVALILFLFGISLFVRGQVVRGQARLRCFERRDAWWLGVGRWIGVVAVLYLVSLVISSLLSGIQPVLRFWGAYPRYQGLFFFLHIAGLASYITFFASDRLTRRLAPAAILWSGVGVSLVALAQRWIPALNQWWDVDFFIGRAYATLGHPNYLADYIILVFPLVYWFLCVSRWRFRWVVGGVSALVMAGALLLTLSRSGVLGLVAALFVLAAGYAWHGVPHRQMSHRYILRRVMVACIAGVMIAGTLTFVFVQRYSDSPFVSHTMLLSRLVIRGENARSLESRAVLWPTAWNLALQQPIFGHGLDTFSVAFTRIMPPELLKLEGLTAYADRAHNVVIDQIYENGFVGAGLFFALWLMAIIVAFRARDPLLLALSAALTGHLVSQQFNFQVAAHHVVFWLYIAIIIVLSSRCRWREIGWSNFHHIAVRRIGAVVLMIALVAYEVVFVYLPWHADRLARVARDAYADISNGDVSNCKTDYIDLTLDSLARAIGYAPYRGEYRLRYIDNALTFVEQCDHRFLPAYGDKIAALLATLPDVANYSRYAVDYRAPWYRARYADLLGDTSAEPYYREALSAAPRVPLLIYSYGDFLFRHGRYQEAIDQWHAFVEMAPDIWKRKIQYITGALDASQRHQYEIFYKLYPNFDLIFDRIEEAEMRLAQ